MNLTLITEKEKQHYVLIKDFNKLMYKKTKHQHRKYFCMHCLQCFSSENVLNNHKTNCVTIYGTQAIKMPEKGDNILNSTIPTNSYRNLLSFMQILKVLPKKYKHVNLTIINYLQKLTRNIQTVDMLIK